MKSVKKRALSKVFFEDLKDKELKPILNLVNSDDTLCLELRGDNVVIYYRGGALYTINEKNDQCNYEVVFNADYKKNKIIKKESDNKEILTVKEACDNVGKYKTIMDKYFSKHKKYEREFQQLIVRENNYSGKITDATDYYIMDMEYALNEEDISARYDMLAILWPSRSSERKNKENLPLTFIEVKYGDDAMKSDRGASGVLKHIGDYIKLRKKPEVIAEIAKDMEKVFEQKHKLGLITSYKNNEELNITIDKNKVEYLFIFANHDPDKKNVYDELKEAIKKYSKKGSEDVEYLKEIKVAKASEMGYGLFAYKGKNFSYPTIEEYVENN